MRHATYVKSPDKLDCLRGVANGTRTHDSGTTTRCDNHFTMATMVLNCGVFIPQKNLLGKSGQERKTIALAIALPGVPGWNRTIMTSLEGWRTIRCATGT